jgi:four helix bundle protein
LVIWSSSRQVAKSEGLQDEKPMARVERVEDLEVWKLARVMTRRVYELTRTGEIAKDFGYKDQVRRAALSVMLNICEGFERESGDRDFKHFLSVAKGSAGELRVAFYTGIDCGYSSQEQFEELMQLALSTIRMLSSFIAYLKACESRPTS